MALYSLNLSVVSNAAAESRGKTAAKLLYACARGTIFSARTGLDDFSRASLTKFAILREQKAGKNGRVAECIIVALPTEATPEQHARLLTTFANLVTKGKAAWIAAIHYDRLGNPHAHLFLFDEEEPRQRGQRGRSRKVLGLSKDGALEDVRALWTIVHNSLMDKWGYGPRSHINHRSLLSQGADRQATLHEGPKVRALARKGERPASRVRWKNGREIRWPQIDELATRLETNRLVQEANNLAQQDQPHATPAPQVAVDMDKIDDGDHRPFGAGQSNPLSPAPCGFDERDRSAGGDVSEGRHHDERQNYATGGQNAAEADAVRGALGNDAASGGASSTASNTAAFLALLALDRGGDHRGVSRGRGRYRRAAQRLYSPARLRAVVEQRLKAFSFAAEAARSMIEFMRRADWRMLGASAKASRKPVVVPGSHFRAAESRTTREGHLARD